MPEKPTSVVQMMIVEGKRIEKEYQDDRALRETYAIAERQEAALKKLTLILPKELHSQIVIQQPPSLNADPSVYFTVGDLYLRYNSEYKYFDVFAGGHWWSFKGYSALCLLLAREAK